MHSPLDSPVHDVVSGDEWGDDVEDLCAGSSPCVEDGGVGGAGEGVLSVGGQTVGHDALLLLDLGSCWVASLVSARCFVEVWVLLDGRSGVEVEVEVEVQPFQMPPSHMCPRSRLFCVLRSWCFLFPFFSSWSSAARNASSLTEGAVSTKVPAMEAVSKDVAMFTRSSSGSTAKKSRGHCRLRLADSLVVHAEGGIAATATEKDLSGPHFRLYGL